MTFPNTTIISITSLRWQWQPGVEGHTLNFECDVKLFHASTVQCCYNMESPSNCIFTWGLPSIFCALVDRMDRKVKEQKRHQQKHSGPKVEKKKLKRQGGSAEDDERKRNPKAFAVQSAVRMAKTFHRSVCCQNQYKGVKHFGYQYFIPWTHIFSKDPSNVIINTGYVTEAGYLVVTTFTLIIVNYPKHSFLHYICKNVFKLLYIGQRMWYLYIYDRPMLADNFSQLLYQSGLKCKLKSILTITPSRVQTNNHIIYGSDCELYVSMSLIYLYFISSILLKFFIFSHRTLCFVLVRLRPNK